MNEQEMREMDRRGARLMRVVVIRNWLDQGMITREEALELLAGRLNPDDPTTLQDDRYLIDLAFDETVRVVAEGGAIDG